MQLITQCLQVVRDDDVLHEPRMSLSEHAPVHFVGRDTRPFLTVVFFPALFSHWLFPAHSKYAGAAFHDDGLQDERQRFPFLLGLIFHLPPCRLLGTSLFPLFVGRFFPVCLPAFFLSFRRL